MPDAIFVTQLQFETKTIKRFNTRTSTHLGVLLLEQSLHTHTHSWTFSVRSVLFLLHMKREVALKIWRVAEFYVFEKDLRDASSFSWSSNDRQIRTKRPLRTLLYKFRWETESKVYLCVRHIIMKRSNHLNLFFPNSSEVSNRLVHFLCLESCLCLNELIRAKLSFSVLSWN